jgi:hypothetical protein
VGSNKSNFCIQTGANGSISGLPVRFCVQNNGNVNIGSSQQKTHAFNVEGASNFENSITATSFIGLLTGNAATATKVSTITNSDIVQLTSVQTLTNKTLTDPTITGVLFFTGSRIDPEPAAGSNATIQLHSDSGRYTINAQHTNGDYQVYDNDNSRRVFRYSQATQSTTFDTDFNLSSGKLYEINDIQIDSEDILYVSSGTDTLKTKINSKQDVLTFGISIGNSLELQDDVVTNDILIAGNTNVIGVTYNELKTLLSSNNVLNIDVSTLNGTNLNYVNNKINLNTTLNGITLNDPNILTNCTIEATSGYDSLEIGGPSGGFIDLKSPFSDDYDLRMIHDGGESKVVSKSNLILASNIIPALTMDTSQNSTFAGDLTLTGSFIGQINPYITTTNVIYDQLIVAYRASGIVPLPPSNLPLIIPTTNVITVNSSTGLLKSKSIEVSGDITGVSNFTSTNINSTTLNTSNVNATGDIDCRDIDYRDIDCRKLTGGTNNSAGNFHIDNTTVSGEMFINYDHNKYLRYGNVPATSLTL